MLVALARTTSQTHAEAIRDAINKHITRGTFVSFKYHHSVLPTERFSFHVSSHLWREKHTARDIKDDRGLRETWDLEFLSSNIPGFIYEYKISIVISKVDEKNCVTVGFADRHFDTDEAEDDLNFFLDNRIDPFSKDSVDDPLSDIGEYFLKIVSIQLHSIENEWDQLLEKLEEGVQSLEKQQYFPSQEQELINHLSSHNQSLHTYEQSVLRAGEILGKLSNSQTRTVTSLETFLKQDAKKFKQTPRSREYFSTLQVIVDGLKFLNGRSQSLAERCDKLIASLSLRHGFVGIQAGKRNETLVKIATLAAETSNKIEIMVLWSAPFGMGMALLNLDSSFIPFVQRKFTGLLLVCLVFLSIFGFAFFILEHRTLIWNLFNIPASERHQRDQCSIWAPCQFFGRLKANKRSRDKLPTHSEV